MNFLSPVIQRLAAVMPGWLPVENQERQGSLSRNAVWGWLPYDSKVDGWHSLPRRFGEQATWMKRRLLKSHAASDWKERTYSIINGLTTDPDGVWSC